MAKREAFSVNEDKLKEMMANDTSADGTLKTFRMKEEPEVPQVQEVAEKAPAVPQKANRMSTSNLAGKAEKYEAVFLSRKESVHRKQTYISYETYRKLARILPLLSEGMTVPAFLDNVLDQHLKQYDEELGELVRRNTQNKL